MSSQPVPFVLSITVPRGTKWDGQRASQLMRQLLLGFEALFFRIVATHDRITWEILDPLIRDERAIETAIRASYPQATVNVHPFGSTEPPNQYPLYRRVLKYQQHVETFLAPIVYAEDITSLDPLSHLTEVMSNLQPGEVIRYYIFVNGLAPEAYKKGEKQLTRNIYDGTVSGFVNPYKTDKYTGEITRLCQGKLAERLYHTSIFIQIDSPNPHRLNSLLVIDNQMVSFDRSKFGQLRWIDDGQKTLTINDEASSWNTSALEQYFAILEEKDGFFRKNELKQQIDLILEPRELAALWHLPHSDFTAAPIQWSYSNIRIPSILRGKREGVCLGVNQFAGRDELIYIPERSGHISIFGKAGVGKSNLMHHLIHQDIAAGQGVAVIDPHGQLVSDVLRYSIPANREKDVVVIDISDEDYPIPLNMLSVPPGIAREMGAMQLIGVLDRLYDLSSTPTVADALYASLVTLLHDEQPTIRDVAKLFRDEAYRERLMEKITNVAALEFWERFNEQKSGRDQVSRPVLWRLRSLYGNSILYPILCHPDALDIASIVAQNKILLVSLKADETRIPAREQYLLGLVLLTQLQQTVMARRHGSKMFYLYVDEVQHFVTTTFDILLSEARKYGLSLTTANQYLRQLAGTMLDAILGNVGTMVVFQTGLDDANLLAPYLYPNFTAEHLMHLHKHEAAIITRYNTESVTPFSLKTLPPLAQNQSLHHALAREAYLRKLSRNNYVPKSKQEVMNALALRYGKVAFQQGSNIALEIKDFD